MSKKYMIALGAAFGIAAGTYATNMVQIEGEYTGKVTDYTINCHMVVDETLTGPKVSIETYLDRVVIDGTKDFHLTKPISMDKGDSSFYLRLAANGYKASKGFIDASIDDPVKIGDRVHIKYSTTFWEQAKNYLRDQNLLRANYPQRQNAAQLEVLFR